MQLQTGRKPLDNGSGIWSARSQVIGGSRLSHPFSVSEVLAPQRAIEMNSQAVSAGTALDCGTGIAYATRAWQKSEDLRHG